MTASEPREPFHPWYHTSGAYYRNVNFNNTRFRSTTIINNRNFNYGYAHNTRAVTVASHNNFVNGQAVNRGAYHVTESSLRGAQVVVRVNAALGSNVTASSLFKRPTVAEFAVEVAASANVGLRPGPPPILRRPRERRAPSTRGQLED